MSSQDTYDGPREQKNNLAVMQDIWDLRELIAKLNIGDVSGMICWPNSDAGAKLNNPRQELSITLNHPSIDCKDVCIFDTVLEQWVGAQVNDISATQTSITFDSVIDSNRYCVYIRGIPTA